MNIKFILTRPITNHKMVRFKVHKAAGNDHTAQLRVQQRNINSYNLTYVEYEAADYRSKKSGGSYQVFKDMRKPHDDLYKWVNWFHSDYLNYYAKHFNEWDESRAPVSGEPLFKAFAEVPLFKEYVYQHKGVWTGLIHYYHNTSGIPDPQGVLRMQQEIYFLHAIFPLSLNFIAQADEQIRVQNAQKFGLTAYYD